MSIVEAETPEPRANGRKRQVAVADKPAPMTAELAWLQTIKELAPVVGIEGVRDLMTMRREESDRRSRAEFLTALAEMQAKMPAVERKGKGHNNKKYARYEDFIETIREPLAAHGFSLTHRIDQTQDAIRVTGVLGHRGGHEERTSILLPIDATGNKNPVQALGSSTSYGKRYVGFALLGVAAEDEDDDGKAAGVGAKINAEDVEKLRSLIMETKSDLAFFYNLFEIECLEDMPQAKLSTAVKMLELKKSKVQK